MKIKVIDLFNMIANGEDVPKTIRFNGLEYDYNEFYSDYMCDTGEMVASLLEQHNDNLNHFLQEEVEIIEDKPKEIKKISLDIDKFEDSYYDTALIKIAGVVDEIIDKVNEMSKGEK